MSVQCLVALDQADVAAANAQIESNSGIPTPDGKTLYWDVPKQAYQQNFWFIIAPPVQGWNGYTQSQMMDKVGNVGLEMSEPNWWPQIIPPGK